MLDIKAENGNIILKMMAPKTERDIKNIPGVIEVGLFTGLADYYKITGENDFSSKRG
jgi:ribose 5-phosphate isomerase